MFHGLLTAYSNKNYDYFYDLLENKPKDDGWLY
jgi:hypothetical protein